MNFNDFKEIIQKRAKINSEWYTEIEKIWGEMISLFSNDIEKTILFIKTDCTADEFVWLSEIFEEIAEKTKSKEFIDCLYETARKFPDETKQYNIISFIDDAAELLQ